MVLTVQKSHVRTLETQCLGISYAMPSQSRVLGVGDIFRDLPWLCMKNKFLVTFHRCPGVYRVVVRLVFYCLRVGGSFTGL